MRLSLTIPIALLLLSMLSPPSFAEDAADLILAGGVLYPVSTEGSVNGSLAVREGRIVYLGPDEGAAALRGPGTRVIELAGRAVTPGLIDSHAHLAGMGTALSQLDLVGTGSYAEIINRVVAAAIEQPAGRWIRGRGWDQNDWRVQEFPTHGELSRTVPDHPVWLTRIDGHAVLLNARAMAMLGVDQGVEDPPGGRYLRGENGELTGVLLDNAKDDVFERLPGPTAEERRQRILLGARHCLERGLTTVTDMGVKQERYEAYKALRQAGELPLRAALFLEDEEELLAAWLERGPEIDPEARLLVRGIKLYADGALGSRGAALIEPYSDDPGNRGLLVTQPEHMEEVCGRALETGFQVGVHTIGDRGAKLTLDAMESCFAGRPRPEARFRIEHAQVMRLVDIQRMVDLGVIAAMQPTHATSDMPWAEVRVGAERLQGAYAWQKVLKAGGRLALGSDFPTESADPRLGLYAAVTRQDLEGEPPGGWLPEERLDRHEALRGFTLDAAWSLFLDEETGSLEVGKWADLVVFARDPMRVPVEEIPQVEIDLTLVDGEIAFQREAQR